MLPRLRRWYVPLVLGLFHAAVLFAALNVLASGFLKAFPQDPISLTYGTRSFAAVYPGWSPQDVAQLLFETWSRPGAFEPLTDAKEPPYTGRFVNVHAAGFRLSREQGPWPLDPGCPCVFLFGGSTAFGYGLPDGETIASHLQAFLAAREPSARCYNFGRGGYYSSQERVLFEQLLAAGTVPRVAVFLDGLNEFVFDQPQFTARLEGFVGTPALTSASMLWRVAAAWGVKPLFVWQPVPTYKYDLDYHPFGSFDFGLNHYSAFGYARMAERLPAPARGPDFLWAADMQEGVREPLYVDEIHYTAAMSRRVAEEIGTALVQRGLVTASGR